MTDNVILNALMILYQDNQKMLTTDGLSTLLAEYRCLHLENYQPKVYPSLRAPEVALNLAGIPMHAKDVWQRIAADPQGWALDAPEEVIEGANWYGNISKTFGSYGMAQIMAYQNVRDIIQELQRNFNISSCHLVQKNIRGVEINYMDRDEQLLMMPVDYEILEYYARRVIYKFLKVIKLQPEKYNLCQINDEEELPTTYSQVRSLASSSVYAWISTESLNWEKMPDGSWTGHYVCDRLNPDKITLHVSTFWDEGEPGDYITFEARHPDPTRFPYRN